MPHDSGCDKLFSVGSNLVSHMRTHIGKSPMRVLIQDAINHLPEGIIWQTICALTQGKSHMPALILDAINHLPKRVV